MSNLQAIYSEVSDEELIKVYSELDQFNEDAQEVIKHEVKTRGISKESLERNVEQIKTFQRSKAEEPLNFLIALIFLVTGLIGLAIGYFISSMYKRNGYYLKASQVWSWAKFGFIIQIILFFLNKFR